MMQGYFLKVSQFIDILHYPSAELLDRYLLAAIFCRAIQNILIASQ